MLVENEIIGVLSHTHKYLNNKIKKKHTSKIFERKYHSRQGVQIVFCVLEIDEGKMKLNTQIRAHTRIETANNKRTRANQV